jgi:hypothetical protein
VSNSAGEAWFCRKTSRKVELAIDEAGTYSDSPLSIAVQRMIEPPLFTTMLAVPIISTEGEPLPLFTFS